jgi:hypothetical protein
MATSLIIEIWDKVKRFENEVYAIVSKHESSKSRVITLNSTIKEILKLSKKQQSFFYDSVKCITHALYKAAHVMAWAGFIDFIEDNLDLSTLYKKHPKWKTWKTIEEIRENITEHQLIFEAKETGVITGSQMKTLHGLLSTRNECAHPSDYDPNLNETLGYVSSLLTRILNISGKISSVT